MLTWRLWRSLKKPAADHPLFKRVIEDIPRPMAWYVALGIVLVAPFLLLPAFLFLSAAYSLRWAVVTAGYIAREREAGMYDLVALSPAGALGSSWAICSACLHRNHSLEQIQSPGAWIMRIGFSLLLAATFGNLVTPIVPYETDWQTAQFVGALYLGTMCAAIYLDHVQSVTLGALVGMYAPVYARGRVDASGAALLGYLLVQVGSFMPTILVGFVILPGILEAIGSDPLTIAWLLPLPRLATFYILREFIILVLWRALMNETNAGADDLDFMTP